MTGRPATSTSRWPIRIRWWPWLLTLLLLGSWSGLALGQIPAPAEAVRLIPLEAEVNGQPGGTWLFVERAGIFHVPREALSAWRIILPVDSQPILIRGLSYWPLSGLTGVQTTLDPASQSIAISFAPESFETTHLTRVAVARPEPGPVLPSLFFNYDLGYTRTELRDMRVSRELGLIGELGLSNELGVLTHTAAGRNVTDNAESSTPRNWVRLNTTFTRDFPASRRTLRLGDSMTRSGMWGRNVYFGGIQFGSNLVLAQDLWSQPMPVLTGSAAAPSTVQLYVNNVLRQEANVPAGPFVADNLPLLSGSGEVRMVVRDILGRETVLTRRFFTSPQLLRVGQNDWNIEAGRLRHNFGHTSADYGTGFASGMWRHGWRDHLTLETRGEWQESQRNLGLGLTATLPGQLLGRLAGIVSEAPALGAGRQWLFGLAYPGQSVDAQFEVQRADESFRQLGLEIGTPPSQEQVMASLNFRLPGDLASLGCNLVSIVPYDMVGTRSVSVNFATRVGQRSTLNLFATRTTADSSTSLVGMTLVVPLDARRVSVTSVSNHNGTPEAFASTSQNPGRATGLGWRVLAGQSSGQDTPQRRAEGGLSYLGRQGQLSAETSVSSEQTALRLGARGGLVLVEDRLFATRHQDRSFALAEVKGYADIGIGLGSNVMARTDADGFALIPELAPYMPNQIQIDPRELPLSAEIDSIERIVVPAWRSVVKVAFPVRSGRGALLKLVQVDQQEIPAGALVRIEGDAQTFYVARHGQAFVTGLQADNWLRITWNNRQCRLHLTLPPGGPGDILRLGPLKCEEVNR